MFWAYMTIIRIPTGETPFLLSYEYKVMVPVEIGMSLLRKENYD